MTINLTQKQILNLMQELPEEHWFQPILLEDLNEKVGVVVKQPEVKPANTFEFPPPYKYLGGKKPPKGANECQWGTYGCYCGAETEPSKEFCNYHTKTCTVCGDEAVKGCPMEYQFVCGAPICAKHEHCKGCATRFN